MTLTAAIDQDEKLRMIIEDFGGHYCQKADIRLGGRRFLCATLWTDMRLGGSISDNTAEAAKVMNDYKHIRVAGRGYARLRPADTIAIHQDHLAWLEHSLATPFVGDTVVVSHHAPLPNCLPDGHVLPAAYASDLSATILKYQPIVWAHGHVHQHCTVQLGKTHILNVSLGYPAAVDPDQPRNDPLSGLILWVGPKVAIPAN